MFQLPLIYDQVNQEFSVPIGGDTLNPSSLGTGTPTASTYLNGVGQWVTPPGVAYAGLLATFPAPTTSGQTAFATDVGISEFVADGSQFSRIPNIGLAYAMAQHMALN